MRGVRQVPYRLPELMEAIASGKSIVIVEGEKDVNNLAEWGSVPATCNAGGAGKWPDEIIEFFRGADVVIVRDNDPQARNKKTGDLLHWPAEHPIFPGKPLFPGQDHGELVAHKLSGVAKRIRVVDLPDLPLKGDVSDWIENGGRPGQFWEIVEATPTWVKPAPKIHSKFGGQRWEEIASNPAAETYAWLVEDVIPLGEISLVFGDSGTGKSFDQFAMAMCVALGEKFNGHNVEPGLVVYVAAEAGKGFGKRKLAFIKHRQMMGHGSVPFYLCTKRPNFFSGDEDVTALIEEIKVVQKFYQQKLRVIFLDTLSALAPGMNENASQDVSLVRNRLVRMQEAFPGVSIILVHHKPKNGTTPRGHGSLTGDFETTIEYEKLLDQRDSRGLFLHQATVRKQREGKSGVAWQFTLPVFEVGTNRWGNRETSCVSVPYKHNYRRAAGYRATKEEMWLLRALMKGIEENPVRADARTPPGTKMIIEQSTLRKNMRSARLSTGDDRRDDQQIRTAISRSGARLRDAGIIGSVEKEGNAPSLVWFTGKVVLGLSDRVEEDTPASEA